MDNAHMDKVPRRRARSTGPSRSAGPGVRAGRSGSTRVTVRVPAATVDAGAAEATGVVPEDGSTSPAPSPAGRTARSAARRGRMAGSRPAATGPAAVRSTAGRRIGRGAGPDRPSAPMARSRLAMNVAVLGLVFVAVAFILAVPLRNYLSQRDQLAAAVATEHDMTAQQQLLEQQKAALSDPAYLMNQAKQRLQFVKPGDTVYVVHAPPLAKLATAAPAKPKVQTPWYSNLWDTLSDPAAPVAAAAAAPASSTGRAGG